MSEWSWFEDYGSDEYCGYDMTKLGMDQAYLNVINETDKEIYIYQKHQECFGCPYTRISHINGLPLILNNVPQYLYQVSTKDSDKLNQLNYSDILCNLTTNFGEFGIYKLHVNLDECFTNVVKEPISTVFRKGNKQCSNNHLHPILALLTVFILYSLLFGLILGITKIWKRFICQSKEDDTKSQNSKKERIKSLDTFRGISIVVMIFVNFGCGGYELIEHSVWNGLHVADLVFPWFLWIMGACIPISLSSSFKKQTPNTNLLLTISKRSIKLFCIGLFLTSGIYLDYLRIFGVLQRFGICYLTVATICVFLMDRTQNYDDEDKTREKFRDLLKMYKCWIVIIVIFIIYCLLIFLIAEPGCPRGYFGPGGLHDNEKYTNCTGGAFGYVDRFILGNHVYQNPTIRQIYQSQPFDPEGILSCLPSIIQVFFGVQAGVILVVYADHSKRLLRWLSWAVVTGILGGFLCGFSKNDGFIPVNKNLWSISFMLVTTCFAFTLLSFCYILVDIKKWWSGKPFLFAGMNAIIMYIGHEMSSGHFPIRWYLHNGSNHHTHFIAMFENLWGTFFWIFVSYYMFKINYFFSI